jgi:hypothetical protein
MYRRQNQEHHIRLYHICLPMYRIFIRHFQPYHYYLRHTVPCKIRNLYRKGKGNCFCCFRSLSDSCPDLSPEVSLKQFSLYMPGQALRAPEVWGSQDFQTISTWRWQCRHSYALAAFTHQEIFLVLISVIGWINPRATVWPELLSQWKFQFPTGNQTHYLLAWSLVVQPTVLQHTPELPESYKVSHPKGFGNCVKYKVATTFIPNTICRWGLKMWWEVMKQWKQCTLAHVYTVGGRWD